MKGGARKRPFHFYLPLWKHQDSAWHRPLLSSYSIASCPARNTCYGSDSSCGSYESYGTYEKPKAILPCLVLRISSYPVMLIDGKHPVFQTALLDPPPNCAGLRMKEKKRLVAVSVPCPESFRDGAIEEFRPLDALSMEGGRIVGMMELRSLIFLV